MKRISLLRVFVSVIIFYIVGVFLPDLVFENIVYNLVDSDSNKNLSTLGYGFGLFWFSSLFILYLGYVVYKSGGKKSNKRDENE